MTKHSIEICIISARGLGRPTSLLKPHWFAVGWIDPNNKYCSTIHTSGGANPTWKTIFPFSVDDECCNLEELAFTVQVHKRDPVFLRESLHGSATVMLKEFLAKFSRGGGGSRPVFEETGSFQLRKAKSEKPTGFVDISVRISLETVGATSRTGNNKTYSPMDQRNGIALAIEDGPVLSYPAHFRTETQPQYEDKFDNSHPHLYGYYAPQFSYGKPHRPPPAPPQPLPPPPPPPPPQPKYPHAESYVNLPTSGHRGDGDFGMGFAAGSLAAGGDLFGEDFLSTISFPARMEGGSLSLSTDSAF